MVIDLLSSKREDQSDVSHETEKGITQNMMYELTDEATDRSKLSESERKNIPLLKKVFDSIDTDHSGAIDYQELTVFLQNMA